MAVEWNGKKYDKAHPMSKEEFEKLWAEIKEHDRKQEEEAKRNPRPKLHTPLFDRWEADLEDVPKYGL